MAYTTIDDPSAHFTVKTYTGTGSTNAITNDANAGNFKPDWLWIKQRNTTRAHRLITSSFFSTYLQSNVSNAEASNDVVNSLDTNGFTLSTPASVNQSSGTYVAWQWKANGGTTSSNTDGSITTTVQANTTAGFSIVTYTGNATDNATIGHGLGATPEYVIIKNRASSIDWAIGHKSIFGNNAENLRFTTGAAASAGDAAGSHFSRNAPSSTVITLGDGGDGDFSTDTNRAEAHVAYCFTSIKGYSKFGSYTGNGSTDGPFIYTGFKPAWVLIKATDRAAKWFVWDTKRETFNVMDSVVIPSSNEAENTDPAFYLDILSNGFKLRNNFSDLTTSGENFIYAAFAEHPFVSSKGVPVTAR